MGDIKNRCELDIFYKTEEEERNFLGSVYSLINTYGIISSELRNHLFAEVEKNPTSAYAFHF